MHKKWDEMFYFQSFIFVIDYDLTSYLIKKANYIWCQLAKYFKKTEIELPCM